MATAEMTTRSSGNGHAEVHRRTVNVGDTERLLSALGGGALALYGLRRGTLEGLGLAVLGGALVNRGLSGHCSVYAAAGHTSADPSGPRASVAAGRGVKVNQSVTVNRPAEELFHSWRNFETLPQFMKHLVSVRSEGKRSHWVARGPAGSRVEWDAEIINEDANRLIAWRSLPGAVVASAGSVHFETAPGGRGTVVRVELKYDVPGGTLASWLPWLFGEEPTWQVREDLHRFKQLHEAGEIATIEGQPSGR